MLVAWLITCVISAQTAETAPELPPWPPGLSEPAEGPGGTCLAPDLAEATRVRLVACQALPMRCQARLDAAGMRCAAHLAGAVRVCEADCLASGVRRDAADSARWSTLEVVLVGLAVGLAAGGLGVAVGALAID